MTFVLGLIAVLALGWLTYELAHPLDEDSDEDLADMLREPPYDWEHGRG